MKNLILMQEAYISWHPNYNSRRCYEALAVDEDGIEYRVFWDILDDYNERFDEEEFACNWDKPSVAINQDTGEVIDHDFGDIDNNVKIVRVLSVNSVRTVN